MLNDETVAKLKRPLDPKRIKHRQGGGGMQLSYITGHDAIDTANDIFGYGQWGYDLIHNELVSVLDENGQVIGSYYAAGLRLTVEGCVPITEEGVCAVQEGRNPRAKIDAHDMARKGAITDALKRALRCYGDQFGNSLYDNETSHQNRNTSQSATHPAARPAPAPAPASQPKPKPPATGEGEGNGELSTEQQRQAILKMSARREIGREELESRLHELYGYGLENLTKNNASHFIKVFQEQQ